MSLAQIYGTGVVTRHSRRCQDPREHDCPCGPGYEAWVYDRRRQKKRRKVFRTESEARDWRLKQLRRLYAEAPRREGKIDVAYGLMRRTLQEVDASLAGASAAERVRLRATLASLHEAEDNLLSARLANIVNE